jgi:hypothetical protein
VFTRTGSTWSQQAYIKASNTDAGDGFGWTVAVPDDGNTLVVGAPNESGGVGGIDGNGADNTQTGSGAAYVFTRSGTTWSQNAYVKTAHPRASTNFGHRATMAFDGLSFTVGAANDDSGSTMVDGNDQDASAMNAGAAWVFVRSGATWVQQHYLKAANAEADDQFGYIGQGGVLIIGAPGEDSAAAGIDGPEDNNSASSAGAVYEFE